MRDFVATYMNRNASTEDFERVVEKHMRPSMDMGDHTMGWFFNQWVYGTAIPKYKFDYTVTPDADGKFLLKATLTESEVTPDFVMPVPLYVDFDGQLVRLGFVRMRGNSTNDKIEVKLPKKPKRVLINAYHDVLEM
jgi:aminopeptidase N